MSVLCYLEIIIRESWGGKYNFTGHNEFLCSNKSICSLIIAGANLRNEFSRARKKLKLYMRLIFKDIGKNLRKFKQITWAPPHWFSKIQCFFYGDVILKNLFRSGITKTADLVSWYFTVRWLEWSYYYYKIGVRRREEEEEERSRRESQCGRHV